MEIKNTEIPCQPDIERAILAEMMIEPETVVRQVIEAGEGLFYKPQNEVIFKAIENLHEHGEDINQETLTEKLRENKQLDKIGGAITIAHIMNETCTTANFLSHIALLKKYATRRKLLNLAIVTETTCLNDNNNPADIVDNIENQLSVIKKFMFKKRQSLSAKIKKWVSMTTRDFHVSECDRELLIVTERKKATRRKVFQILHESGIIERTGSRHGHYRLVNSESEDINWLDAMIDPIEIKFPLGIEKLVKICHGNLIILAGEPNSGKTGFLLNLVKLNMYKYDIHYFSSEMGSEEFKIRLSEFDDIALKDWKFHAKERSYDFSDVIVPNALNIIDFLERHDEFWKIGGDFKRIFDKLDQGIAVIAIQKNPGANHGLGGTRGIEKARLYLTMEPGKCTIKKAKNYREKEINPNGMEIDFKLVHGCKFMPDETGWHQPENP
ncbi:MAG: hypothetical protein HWN66_16860 [Candidatus Helarchaeota archaeon]|nr:hypothetical protein [Candidatus Helarchaeota archaeon]